MVKLKSRVVGSVQSKLHPHVFNENSLAWFHLIISYAHDERINALIFALDNRLRKHNRVVGMISSICYPELLRGNRGRINNKLLCCRLVRCGSLHFRRIVSVAEFGEAEATHVLQAVYLLHERQMSFGV